MDGQMTDDLALVASLLGYYGLVDEAEPILRKMEEGGVVLPEESATKWYLLYAALRKDLKLGKINYTHVYERLMQLLVKLPMDVAKTLFETRLPIHVIVKSLDEEFCRYSDEDFILEREELLRFNGALEVCREMQRNLISSGDEEGGRQGAPASSLASFIEMVDTLQEEKQPKTKWDAVVKEFSLEESVFRRDMERSLLQMQEATLGRPKHPSPKPRHSRPHKKRKVTHKSEIVQRYPSTAAEWEKGLQDHAISLPSTATEDDTKSSTAVANDDTSSIESESDDNKAQPQPAPRKTRASSRARRFWSIEETEALMAGLHKFHGRDKMWSLIKQEHSDVLAHRSNVDLKDKYRNLIKFGKLEI